MKDRYIFTAIFEYADDGINITFPDLSGCISCADKDNTEEAFIMAKDVLGLFLWGMEKDGEEIPQPSNIKNLKVQENQALTIIEVYMPTVRSEMNNKAVKKTLTIPQWLNDIAEREHINFSHCLQEALKERLHLNK